MVNFEAMKLLNQLPNTLTLLNLTLGVLAIIAILNGLVPIAIACVGGSLIADIFDGALARKLGVAGELGIQLDSLADVVSFGVLPGIMIYASYAMYGHDDSYLVFISILSAFVAASAGLRLARFNVDTRPREFFWGLATPSGGILVTGWLWAQFIERDYGLGAGDNPWSGIVIAIFLIIMFQVPLKLPGLKSPKAGLLTAAILVIGIIAGFFVMGPIIIPIGIVSYVMLGLLNLVVKWY